MDQASKSKLRDLAWAAPLVAWYGWNLRRGAPFVLRALAALARGGADPLAWARAGAVVSSTAFCGLLVAVLLARLPPRAAEDGWGPRLAAVLGTFAASGFPGLAPARLSPGLALASAALIAAGFGAALAALAWLGRSFSLVPEARRLVTRGPYALCRHPLYAVEQLALLGVCLQYAQPWSALLFLAQAAIVPVRIRYEERVLARAFPEYGTYAARTARLVPGLY